MTTIIFPGQGSQFVGMARDFYENFAVAKDVFENVEDTTKIRIKDIIFTNEDNLLNITQYTQLSIFTVSIAIFEVFKHVFDKTTINFALGHSLGEYSALVASRSISLKECSMILKTRGELMQNAYPENKSGMAAVLGLNCSEIEKIINENSLNVEIANDNAPGQVVISGIIENINTAEKILIVNGAKKVIYLNVSAAFHSAIMKKAEKEMKNYLSRIDFNNSVYSIISNYTATASNEKKILFENLSNQMSNKVRWTESIKLLDKMGEKIIIEMGPGKVLSGLIKRISNNFSLYNFNNIQDIEILKNVL